MNYGNRTVMVKDAKHCDNQKMDETSNKAKVETSNLIVKMLHRMLKMKPAPRIKVYQVVTKSTTMKLGSEEVEEFSITNIG